MFLLQDALNLSRQQIQELMALRRVFLPKMGQLLKDRHRISRALQDSQVPFTPPSLAYCLPLCLCMPSVGLPLLPPSLACYVPFASACPLPLLALCLCLPSAGSLHGSLHFPLVWLTPLPSAFACPLLVPRMAPFASSCHVPYAFACPLLAPCMVFLNLPFPGLPPCPLPFACPLLAHCMPFPFPFASSTPCPLLALGLALTCVLFTLVLSTVCSFACRRQGCLLHVLLCLCLSSGCA